METPLLVWPRTYPVGPVPMVSGAVQVEGNVSRNKVGSNGDVLGVRPYRRGDSPRRIHWGQSARHDRLIVCELQSNSRPVVQLILDTDPTVHVGSGPDSSREWAIRIASSLAKGWLAVGVEVGAVWNGLEISPASGPEQLKRLLDSLARISDTAGTPLNETMSRPTCRGFTHGLQVIVTTDAGANRADPRREAEDQRWVILQFRRDAQRNETARLPIRPWLLLDAPEHIPPLLRGGWKEAVHGS